MPSKTMHIVLETGSISGGVKVVGELANGLSRRGYEVTIWSIHERQTMDWFPLDKKVEWASFFRTGTTSDYDQLAHVLAKQEGFKMATYWATAFAVQHAAREGEGLYLIQDVEVVYAFGPLRQAQVMKTYDLGLRGITTSKWVQSQLGCDYIGIGLDPYFKPLDKKKGKHIQRTINPIACARRQALKGWVQLCEVARLCELARIPIATFGQDDSLALFAKHRHIPRPDNKSLREMYNMAGAFFSTSLHEGLSLTPLEAMACGCPVVMTDADGNMEYAVDDINCLIASDPRDLTEKLQQVIKDQELAKRLAAEGLKTAAEYHWQPVFERLEKILA